MRSGTCQEWHRQNTTIQTKRLKEQWELLKSDWQKKKVCFLLWYVKAALPLRRGKVVKHLSWKEGVERKKNRPWCSCVFVEKHLFQVTLSSLLVIFISCKTSYLPTPLSYLPTSYHGDRHKLKFSEICEKETRTKNWNMKEPIKLLHY